MFFKKKFNVLECREKYFVGRLEARLVRCGKLHVHGHILVHGLTAVDELVVIGSGFIDFLACNKVLIVTRGKPFFMNKMYCNKAFLIGVYHPIIIDFAKTIEIYTSNVLVKKLKTRTGFFGRKTGIKTLEDCKKLVFNDPHCWIEEFREKPSNIVYRYNVFSSNK